MERLSGASIGICLYPPRGRVDVLLDLKKPHKTLNSKSLMAQCAYDEDSKVVCLRLVLGLNIEKCDQSSFKGEICFIYVKL